MKSYIIGISGKANSGKDTIASMINYIFTVGVAKASYVDYIVKRRTIDIEQSDRIIHFADNLKDVLSIMFNIKRKYFDDREHKDLYYYCLDTGEFVIDGEVDKWKEKYIVIDNDFLKNTTLAEVINNNYYKWRVIKLRTLMQYVGTDICRNLLDNNIWVKSTIHNAVDKARARRVCLIPDVRFTNEADSIMNTKVDDIAGWVIKVNRPDIDIINHVSERELENVDYEIDNSSTRTALFYKVLEVCNQIIYG